MIAKFKFLCLFALWLLYPSALNTDKIGKYNGKGTKILMIYHVGYYRFVSNQILSSKRKSFLHITLQFMFRAVI